MSKKIMRDHLFEVGQILDDLNNGKLKILKQTRMQTRNKKAYEYECLICGNIDYIVESSLFKKQGCRVCANKKILIGFNDAWTTNPDFAKSFANPQDGYVYSAQSKAKIPFKCPNCNLELGSKIIDSVFRQGISCPRCSDGISYPNKFMFGVLSQIDVEFETEKEFHWFSDRRYDFYIPSFNLIIEVHGGQHFKEGFSTVGGRTLEEEKENDRLKKEHAFQNGCSYVVVDARYSDMEYIKNSILKSEITKLVDLSNINWLQSHEYACTPLAKIACDLWNDGVKNTLEIAKMMKVCRKTATDYLKMGASINWCDYDPKEESIKASKTGGIPVVRLTKDGQYIDKFNNASEAERQTGVFSQNIHAVCKNTQKTAHGYIWMYEDDWLSSCI